MRPCIFPIAGIPSRTLPINKGDHFGITNENVLDTEISVRKADFVLALVYLQDLRTKRQTDLAPTLAQCHLVHNHKTQQCRRKVQIA